MTALTTTRWKRIQYTSNSFGGRNDGLRAFLESGSGVCEASSELLGGGKARNGVHRLSGRVVDKTRPAQMLPYVFPVVI